MSAAANAGSSFRGWMQSTGQTSTHAVSFVPTQGSQIIYAIPPITIIPHQTMPSVLRRATLISSLRGRIFLASALLAVLTCGVALFVVNRRVTNEGEASLKREILVSGAIVDQLRTERTETYTVTARLIADSPTLKAAVTTDAATVQNE